MNWCGKKVLITGAGGFLGSHLTEELIRRKADVRAMVHYNSQNSWGNLELLDSKPNVIAGDIRDPFFMRKAVKDCEYVFHLAALIAIPFSYIAPSEYIETNVKGTLNVMQACLDEGVKKVVHTSTSEVYGTARYVPMDEEHPLQAQSPYSASKIGADKVAESYFDSFGLPVATLRPFNTFGGRQSARAVIPTIITQVLTQPTVKLGSLDPVRDFTYIDDTVDAFIKVAECRKAVGQVMNCGTGEARSIGSIADFLNRMIARNKVKLVRDAVRVRPKKSEVMWLECDNSKIRKLTGWKPTVEFERGLGCTAKYIQENISRYKPEIYNL